MSGIARIFCTLLVAAFGVGCLADAGDLEEVGARHDALVPVDRGGLPARGASGGSPGPDIDPPPRPPEFSDDAEGQFALYDVRFQLAVAGELLIDDINEDIAEAGLDGNIDWSTDGIPTGCGYDCMYSPRMSSTRYTDRPNYWYAGFTAYLRFDLDLPYGFSREIITRVEYRLYCTGWDSEGGGAMGGYFVVDDTWAEGGGGWEGILDFLWPFGLTDWIDTKVAENLPGGSGRQYLDIDSRCSSLGVVSNWGWDEGWRYDNIRWDIPEPLPTRTRVPAPSGGYYAP